MKSLVLLVFTLLCLQGFGQTIVNGVPWFDQNGNTVNAHGAGIIRDGGCWWLFGEYKSDTTNAFPGFGCYSSDDLVHWIFESVVLPVQKDGILGPQRVGERPKVMRCPKTGECVLFAHASPSGIMCILCMVAYANRWRQPVYPTILGDMESAYSQGHRHAVWWQAVVNGV